MATIDIRQSHSLPMDDVRKRAEDLASSMKQKLELDWHWEGDRILFAASSGAARGTKGSVEVSARDVRVQIELPILLRMLKSTVQAKVAEKLAEIL